MAEGVGFEPTRTFALPVFKTGAINRSTTPPIPVGAYSGICLEWDKADVREVEVRRVAANKLIRSLGLERVHRRRDRS